MIPAPGQIRQPAIQRLEMLAPLDDKARDALEFAVGQAWTVRARRDIIGEGSEIAGPRLIVSGWAARVRHLADGRRQFLSFLLPGDVVGLCRHPDPISLCNVTTLNKVLICAAPSASDVPSLGLAYAIAAAFEEAYLLEHVTRLGRLSAQERIYSLLLELHERLLPIGLAFDGCFDLPLTQEILADAVGLTSVHVNRMLQQARRAGAIDLQGGRVRLHDPAALARMIGRSPTQVSVRR